MPAASPRDLLTLDADVVDLRAWPRSRYVPDIRRRYAEAGEGPGGLSKYSDDDWRRISFAYDRIRKGGDILDVGVGAGEFFNLLGISKQFRSVNGVDRIVFGRYLELADNVTRHDANIADLPFDDDTFDVVVCMEVLEHVEEDDFHAGMAELRRVCRGQLIMTVPYREPEPIYRSHLRRFEDQDIVDCFPDATYTLLDRPSVPWMVAEERFDGTVVEHSGPATTGLEQRVRALEEENRRLKSRKTVRAANWLGRQRARAVAALRR